MDPYLTARWLHILSSTVLFGTGIGTAFQMVWAMRTGRVETIHSVASGVVIADWIFTTPAGVIQPLTGLWLIHLAGYSLTEPWLLATYALYLTRLPVLGPGRASANPHPRSGRPRPWPQARRCPPMRNAISASGAPWAVPAFTALVAVFWLMVNRPDF